MMKINVTYPDFSEKEVSLNDMLKESKYTVLYFYPKDNTPGCTLEAQAFASMAEEFANVGAQVVGVSKDSHKSHCGFVEKHGLPFPLISDPEFSLHNEKKFQAAGEKSMFGKKYIGTIRSTFLLNKDGKVLKEWRKVKVVGHVKAVLDYITGL